jgi:hypothetical protein
LIIGLRTEEQAVNKLVKRVVVVVVIVIIIIIIIIIGGYRTANF